MQHRPRPKTRLRNSVANRLVMPLQAAMLAGLIEPTLKVEA